MFSVKTFASTVAAAGLVSVIGLAYAQTSPPPDSATDRSIQAPVDQGNPTMSNDGTSTQGNTTTLPGNRAGTQGTTTTLDNRSGTQGSTLSSDNDMRADGSSDLEPRADRN